MPDETSARWYSFPNAVPPLPSLRGDLPTRPALVSAELQHTELEFWSCHEHLQASLYSNDCQTQWYATKNKQKNQTHAKSISPFLSFGPAQCLSYHGTPLTQAGVGKAAGPRRLCGGDSSAPRSASMLVAFASPRALPLSRRFLPQAHSRRGREAGLGPPRPTHSPSLGAAGDFSGFTGSACPLSHGRGRALTGTERNEREVTLRQPAGGPGRVRREWRPSLRRGLRLPAPSAASSPSPAAPRRRAGAGGTTTPGRQCAEPAPRGAGPPGNSRSGRGGPLPARWSGRTLLHVRGGRRKLLARVGAAGPSPSCPPPWRPCG